HKYSTANFKIGPRKLGLLAKQISGKPIDYAILQMEFSQKRASGRVKSTLALARDHAVSYKNLQLDKLVVAQSWVTKGPKYLPHIDIKGRGRRGIKHHPDARLHVRLEEGKTYEERVQALRERRLKAIRSAGVVREDMKLRNVAPIWAW
ncbi:ribosomal protein L22, partial [Sistotremastrum niveocremeum HHB9708]